MPFQSTVGRAVLALAASILGSAAAQRPAAVPARPATVTFSGEIRPILQSHCTICHSPGGPSPMALVTYEEVLRWAPKIKEQALTRRMPIWHAARGYGAFLNDPTLSPVDLAAIVAWVDGGRLSGELSPSVAARPQSTAAGAIPVDAVAALVTVRGGWATGWDFVPGDPLISSAAFTSKDSSVIGTWTAGDRAVRLPRDSAVRVTSPVTVEIWRRRPATNEPAIAARPSVLRFRWQ